jgi:ribonuclease P protein component
LTRPAALDRARREGKRYRTASLEVRFLASTSPRPRIGLIVPRHRQTAVARNRVKRRLRELLRVELLPGLRNAASPLDVVVRAAPEAYARDFAGLRDEVSRIVRRLGAAA